MTKILFMGRLRDAAGAEIEEIDLPTGIGTVGDLRAWLSARSPELGGALSSSSVRAAVDLEIVDDGHSVQEAREVAFLPPFSGG
jgi:molybdopterin synthase sulfur carrier subunit